MIRKRISLFTTFYLLFIISLWSCGGGGGGGGTGSTPPSVYNISGTVTSGGSGLAGVTMTLSGASSATTSTDANGAYQFSNLAAGSYTITPSRPTCTFAPSSLSVSVTNSNVTGQNFTGMVVTWIKTYGGVNRDVAHSIQQTSDGGFIVAGETYSFGVVDSDVWIVKIDSTGAIQWEKTYGGNGYEAARSIQQTSDGGFIVAGETSSFSSDTDVWVLKLNTNGTVQWQNRYGGTGVDKAYSLRQTSDSGYILAGETNSSGVAGGIDFWLLKLNANGGVVWQKAYGGGKDDVAYSVQQTSDSGYIVAGETNSFSSGGDVDFWVLKLDANGSVVWQKTYGGSKDDVGYSVQQTSDSGYIVAGKTTTAGTIFDDIWVLKLDTSGNVEWQKTYGGPNDDAAYSIQQTSDSGYIVAGKSGSFGNILGDMWVLKLKANGDVDWQKTYEGNNSNSANFILQTQDGGYILAGETSSFGAGNADIWVLKTDKSGNIGSGCSVEGLPNGTVTTTTVTGVNSLGASGNISVTATPTSVSGLNSGAITNTQCSYP